MCWQHLLIYLKDITKHDLQVSSPVIPHHYAYIDILYYYLV